MSPLGLSVLLSMPLMTGFVFLVYKTDGADWFVGAFGSIIALNIILQCSFYFSLPKAFARRLSDPSTRTAELETLPDGIQVTSGPNSVLLKWERFKHIWVYADFILMAVRPPLVLGFAYLPTDGMTAEVRRDIEAAGARKGRVPASETSTR